MATPSRRITGVIFDVDGTLVDSNDAHAQAWVEALAGAGRQVPFDRVRRLIGMGGDKLLPEVTGLSDESPEGEQISQARSRIFREKYLPRLSALDGAAELLQRVRQAGLARVVASSAKKEELQPLLALTGADDLIPKRTSADDVEESKPDPDIVHAALDRLGKAPSEVVMIGDTPYDLQAAQGAGVRFIGFRSGGWSDADLQGAIAVYDGPADLVAQFDRSPLAPGDDPGATS